MTASAGRTSVGSVPIARTRRPLDWTALRISGTSSLSSQAIWRAVYWQQCGTYVRVLSGDDGHIGDYDYSRRPGAAASRKSAGGLAMTLDMLKVSPLVGQMGTDLAEQF